MIKQRARASAGEGSPFNCSKVLACLRHRLNPQLEAPGHIPAVGKGSESSSQEDTAVAHLPESPDDTGRAEAMPLVGAMSAVESQDLHVRKGLSCPRSQLSCGSVRASSAEIWRALHSCEALMHMISQAQSPSSQSQVLRSKPQ